MFSFCWLSPSLLHYFRLFLKFNSRFRLSQMTRSLITWFFVGWFSLIFIVSRFQSILKFNVLYDFAILRMKLGVKGLINVPLLRNCSIVRSTIGWFDIVIVRLGDSVHFGFFRELSLLVVILLLRAFPLQDISPESFLLSV